MFKYRAAFVLTVFGIFLITASAAQAAIGGVSEEKNLRGRLGVGFVNQITTNAAGNTIPALSAKYYIGRSFATSLAVGFDTRSGGSTMVLGGKLFKNLFIESNLIFYVGAGLAYINQSGSKLQGSLFFGSEFFLAQIPSLGLTFEAGLRGDNTTGSFAIRTTGDSFLSGGMHFYF